MGDNKGTDQMSWGASPVLPGRPGKTLKIT